jgi:SAM-dependent methyltransferase
MSTKHVGSGANWREGYTTSLDYTAGFYDHLSPEYINFSCVMHGVEPGAVGRRYTYFELGCGLGATVNVLAASNPQAQFFANDFMPSHVASAQQLADAGGLGNLTLLEHSFGELADGAVDLPPLDFITLQGVYTWVSAPVRAQIVRFIHRYLKPGGMVYVSYNAMPGWAASTPVQRLMQACAEWTAGSPLHKVTQAQGFVSRMQASGADYFEGKPELQRRLRQITDFGPAYLTHEYLHKHWEPMYHADVANDLTGAKLDFVGSAMLGQLWLEFEPEQQALIDAIPEPAWRETAKDFMLNSGFRQDVYVRGHRPMTPQRREAVLRGFCAVLTVPLETALARLTQTDPALAQRMRSVLEALSVRPCSVEELRHSPAFLGQEETVLVLLTILLVTHCASVFVGENQAYDCAPAHALNRAIAAQSAHGAVYKALASPLTGSGLPISADDLAVYRQLPPAAPDQSPGDTLNVDDSPIGTPTSLATWRRLKMV